MNQVNTAKWERESPERSAVERRQRSKGSEGPVSGPGPVDSGGYPFPRVRLDPAGQGQRENVRADPSEPPPGRVARAEPALEGRWTRDARGPLREGSCAPVRVVAGCLPPWPMATSGEVRMAQLLINGKTFMVDADPATPLLWVIRERLQLTGTKFGCGIAQCGACTVHLDGAAVRSCQTTLAQAAGKKITTI